MRISDWSSDVCSSDLLHTCAVLGDSTAQCWGYNHSGQLGNGGNDDSNAPVTVSGLTGATGIAAGAYHTCALLVDGTAMCWGNNEVGELGDGGSENSNVPVPVGGLVGAVAIAAGFLHTCAVLDDESGRASCRER